MNSKKLALGAVLVALSVVGGMIKINGSIALDAVAAYFAAAALGGLFGGAIAVLGHFFSALMAGFPLTVPMHLFVMAEMFVIVYLFGKIYERNKYGAAVSSIVLNGPVGTGLAALLATALGMPFAGKIMFGTLVLPVTFASAVNVALAVAVYESIKRTEVVQQWRHQ